MRFFFYGTLIAGNGNAAARAVHAMLRPLGPATIAGLLHAIADPAGWYPALVPGDGMVHGVLYETLPEHGAVDLAALDAYEGGEYERRTIAVADGREAEAYWWQGALPAASPPIPGGDFAVWLAERGLQPYRERGRR